MDKVTIEIDRMHVYARHGVMEQERIVGNEFEVTVELEVSASRAVESDLLETTVNYADVCSVIKQVMAEPSALLEHVCGRLQKALSARFPAITSGCVKVAKLNPPIPNVKLNSVSVSISW